MRKFESCGSHAVPTWCKKYWGILHLQHHVRNTHESALFRKVCCTLQRVYRTGVEPINYTRISRWHGAICTWRNLVANSEFWQGNIYTKHSSHEEVTAGCVARKIVPLLLCNDLYLRFRCHFAYHRRANYPTLVYYTYLRRIFLNARCECVVEDKVFFPEVFADFFVVFLMQKLIKKNHRSIPGYKV